MRALVGVIAAFLVLFINQEGKGELRRLEIIWRDKHTPYVAIDRGLREKDISVFKLSPHLNEFITCESGNNVGNANDFLQKNKVLPVAIVFPTDMPVRDGPSGQAFGPIGSRLGLSNG